MTRALSRVAEVAGATKAGLARRISELGAAAAEKAKRENCDETFARREAFASKQTKFLDETGRVIRKLLREGAEVELAVLAVNKNLPAGAEPIPSVDMIRRVPIAEPKVEVREFKMYVDEAGKPVVEEGGAWAKRLGGGKYEVSLPNGSWPDRTQYFKAYTCTLTNWVEVTTTRRRPYFLGGQFVAEVSIPAAGDGDPAWWTPMEERSGPVHPVNILRRLDQLEAQAPGSGFHEEVDTKRMPAERWRQVQPQRAT